MFKLFFESALGWLGLLFGRYIYPVKPEFIFSKKQNISNHVFVLSIPNKTASVALYL